VNPESSHLEIRPDDGEILCETHADLAGLNATARWCGLFQRGTRLAPPAKRWPKPSMRRSIPIAAPAR